MSRSFIDCKLFSILTSASRGPSSIAELLAETTLSPEFATLSPTKIAHSRGLRKLAYRTLFVALAFSNALDDWNVDERIEIGNDLCTFGINLLRL